VDARPTGLVIDDHPLVARGIADFLQSHCALVQVDAVTDVQGFWAYLESATLPAIVVMDFWLTGVASLSLITEFETRHPATPLLIISADDNAAVESKVRLLGVQGFLNKQAAPEIFAQAAPEIFAQAAPEIFAQAVAALLAGATWFDVRPPASSSAYQSNDLPVTAAELGLTARQGDILSLVMNGLPNKHIARELGLSEQTVKEHVSGILDRLQVTNRIELIKKLRGLRIE
jgi:DNA-binding NarL/FixJ family response regulator